MSTPPYEVHGHRDNGEVFGIAVLARLPDIEAVTLAQQYADRWCAPAPGLQEEGLLISWWFADDPMFSRTAFGGRGKGEGNKTCLPWIAAVGVFAHEELLARHGSTDIASIAFRTKQLAAGFH